MAKNLINGTIQAWTDRPAPGLLLVLCTAALFALAVADTARPNPGEPFIVGAVAAVALLSGAAGGLVAGLAGATAHLALHHAAGTSDPDAAVLSIAAVLSFLAYGWGCGLASAHLRRRHAAAARPPAAGGAGGSQGMLTAAEGRAFLALEGQRARLFGEHPYILTVSATARNGVPAASAARAFRAVARSFEAAAGPRMQPVLLGENQLVMVMLGGTTEGRLQYQRDLTAALAGATFADRPAGTRPRAATVLRLDMGSVDLTRAPSQAEVMITAPVSRRRHPAQAAGVRAKAA